MNSDWNYLYKIVEGNPWVTTNLLYTPTVNSEGTLLCMDWNKNSEYQKDRIFTDELLEFFFDREIKYLEKFQNYDWAPQIMDINLRTKRICIEWNNRSLNHIIFGGGKLDQECPNWKFQIYNMLSDIKNTSHIKNALYPHCFFIGKDNKIKTIDFYSCVSEADPFISYKQIEGMIGTQSVERFITATTDGMIDFRKFFKITMLDHLGKTWPDNPFPEFYKKLYQ
jgi:hypothetical protein